MQSVVLNLSSWVYYWSSSFKATNHPAPRIIKCCLLQFIVQDVQKPLRGALERIRRRSSTSNHQTIGNHIQQLGHWRNQNIHTERESTDGVAASRPIRDNQNLLTRRK